MRIAFIIVSLTAIAVTLVQIRAAENACRNQVLQLKRYCEMEVPRKVWGQQVELAYKTSPLEVQKRAEAMAWLPKLIDKSDRTRVARGDTPDHPRRP